MVQTNDVEKPKMVLMFWFTRDNRGNGRPPWRLVDEIKSAESSKWTRTAND